MANTSTVVFFSSLSLPKVDLTAMWSPKFLLVDATELLKEPQPHIHPHRPYSQIIPGTETPKFAIFILCFAFPDLRYRTSKSVH